MTTIKIILILMSLINDDDFIMDKVTMISLDDAMMRMVLIILMMIVFNRMK